MAGAAGAYSEEAEDRLITDINVTPLVDIVLVLLIVFMITMPTIVRMDWMQESELDIALPEAAEVPLLNEKQRTEMVVNIDAGGRYIVSRVPRSDAELSQLLEEARDRAPKRFAVLIRADKRCAWRDVAAVMTILRKAKIQDSTISMLEQ